MTELKKNKLKFFNSLLQNFFKTYGFILLFAGLLLLVTIVVVTFYFELLRLNKELMLIKAQNRELLTVLAKIKISPPIADVGSGSIAQYWPWAIGAAGVCLLVISGFIFFGGAPLSPSSGAASAASSLSSASAASLNSEPHVIVDSNIMVPDVASNLGLEALSKPLDVPELLSSSQSCGVMDSDITLPILSSVFSADILSSATRQAKKMQTSETTESFGEFLNIKNLPNLLEEEESFFPYNPLNKYNCVTNYIKYQDVLCKLLTNLATSDLSCDMRCFFTAVLQAAIEMDGYITFEILTEMTDRIFKFDATLKSKKCFSKEEKALEDKKALKKALEDKKAFPYKKSNKKK